MSHIVQNPKFGRLRDSLKNRSEKIRTEQVEFPLFYYERFSCDIKICVSDVSRGLRLHSLSTRRLLVCLHEYYLRLVVDRQSMRYAQCEMGPSGS